MGSEAREASRGTRGDASEAVGARRLERWPMPEEAQMARSADFLPVLRADCLLEQESGQGVVRRVLPLIFQCVQMGRWDRILA